MERLPSAPAESPEELRVAQIRELNDKFRQTLLGGEVLTTSGVRAYSAEDQARIIRTVQSFSDFSPDNDPYGEHDFGSFRFEGDVINWKIDYYDANREYASEDPADPKQTRRVLTIMLAQEY